METIDILFEIGVEEIPSAYIEPAIATLKKKLVEIINKNNLKYHEIKMFSTPRRLAFIIKDLKSKQDDTTIEKIGPSTKIAYDEKGNLSKAAIGFLKSVNAKKEDIYIVNTKKGDKIAIKKNIKGKDAKDIFAENLPDIIFGINFPKTMKWATFQNSFARPIRWILALIDNQIWDFDLKGIKSSNFTYGNRFLGLTKKIVINTIENYEKKLVENYVIPDPNSRKEKIVSQLKNEAKKYNLKPYLDENLLNEVNNLIEFPTAVIAEFDKKYLQLPEKIIISTLSKNQKYFPLFNKKNKLSSKFIFISNGNPKFNEIIKVGNQKVVKARLEDAEFYFNEDTKFKLEYFVPRLKNVLFHKDLGTMYEKTERIVKISNYIATKLNLKKEQIKIINRSAYLCKADLVTLMLGEKEFTKLQGYIGNKYALISGEKKEVAIAIEEHYLPKGKDDILPETIYGAIVAIADKMDTICSIFSVNQIPTGSNDPFALRRSAIGIVKIIDKFSFEFNLFHLIDFSFKVLKTEKNKNKVYQFLKARINWYLETLKIDYDVIKSVMHIDYTNLADLKKRAQALQNYKQNEDFKKLVMAFKRVSNIIQNYKNEKEIDTSLFEKNSEFELYKGIVQLERKIQPLLKEKNYFSIMQELVNFSPIINDFFDNVLVNVDNEKIRLNRYGLLYKIRKIFLTFADLNKLE